MSFNQIMKNKQKKKNKETWEITNNPQKTITLETDNKVVNSLDPHPLQENKSHKKELLDSIQNNFIAQTQNLSKVSRTIAGVIIGTIWAICYKERTVDIPNGFILTGLIMSLFYFLVELVQYFFDSYYYHNKSDVIVESEGDFDLKNMTKDVQNHSKWSFRFLLLKSVLVFVACLTFIRGVILLYSPCIKL